jgi:hypothetical protein
MNLRDFAHPPSGLFVLWYNFIFESNSFVDRDGNKFNQLPLSDYFPNLPDIEVTTKLSGYGYSAATFWASGKIAPLGNARFLTGVAPSFVAADASFITARSGIIVDTIFTREAGGRNSGLADLMVVPVGLSWGFEHFDFTFLYGFYAPTGKYETGSDENIGMGFWTHQFQGFTYYYPNPNKATAFLMGLTYEANTEIKDVSVSPGNRFSLEYGISQFFSERFEVGIHGAHNWQVSDDSGEDVYWDPTVNDQKSSLIFSASYWPVKERLMLNFKYGFDYGVRQGFKTNSGNLNIVLIPNLFSMD